MSRIMRRMMVIVCCVPAFLAMAGEVQKADNAEPLAEGASWVGGSVPGTNDVAVWDGETALSGGWNYELGTGVTWGGLRVTNAVSMLTITNGGAPLSVGADGINLAAATNGYYCRLYAPVSVTADQVWRMTSPTVLYLWGPVSGDGALAVGDGIQWGHVVFYDAVNLPQGLTVFGNAQMRTNAVASGPVNVAPGGALYVNKPVDTDWSDTFAARVVTNDGHIAFGGSINLIPSTVTFKPGDGLVSSANSDTWRGRVTVYENNVVQDGGMISNNWWYVNGGCFTQLQGFTFVDYALSVGYGNPGNSIKERRVRVSGGTLDVRRFNVGAGNPEAYPGVLEVAGGAVSACRAENWQSSGVELAAAKTLYDSESSASPAGRLFISGGSLRTMQISFGSMMTERGSTYNVTNGYARFDMRGGEVTVGAAGIGPSPVWNRTAGDGTVSSWYDVVWSGGTLGAYAAYTNRARVRLSDANGGVTVRAADTNGTPYAIVMTEPLTGRGSLRKTGAGALYLGAANTYTGRTVVAEGSLHVADTSLWTTVPGVALPAPDAVWEANTLVGTPGSAVTSWSSTNGTWAFNSTIASAIYAGFTSPKLGTSLLNGHRVVTFNGTSNALALTGNKATPASGATNLTVAVVVRGGGAGRGDSGDWRDGAGIIGQTLYQVGNASTNWWGIGYSAQGRAGAGVGGLVPGVSTAWSVPRELHDGEPHVLIYVWRGGSGVLMNVDGYVTASGASLTVPMLQSRMILGANENKFCFNGDIAEFRFYRAALSADEQTVLALELARKYGAVVAGYRPDGLAPDAPLASREVRIAAGASFYAGASGTPVGSGQVYTGDGDVYGSLNVAMNGVIACGPAEALTLERLVFQPGGIFRWVCGADGSHQPVEVRDLILPQGVVVVDVDTPEEKVRPTGVLIRYSGEIVDNGASWNVHGDHPETAVVVDRKRKMIRLTTPTGTLIRLL